MKNGWWIQNNNEAGFSADRFCFRKMPKENGTDGEMRWEKKSV